MRSPQPRGRARQNWPSIRSTLNSSHYPSHHIPSRQRGASRCHPAAFTQGTSMAALALPDAYGGLMDSRRRNLLFLFSCALVVGVGLGCGPDLRPGEQSDDDTQESPAEIGDDLVGPATEPGKGPDAAPPPESGEPDEEA